MTYKGRQRGTPMSMYQRAAQFAPFAALNGHASAIAETARQNILEYELAEYHKEDYPDDDDF